MEANNDEGSDHDVDNEDELVSRVFFELANAEEICFQCSAGCLRFRQDRSACGQHTGGIIWETSYVLLQYLLDQKEKDKSQDHFLGHALELGAGVGFLGQCLAAGGCVRSIVLTDTAEVVLHAEKNLADNSKLLQNFSVQTCPLDWLHFAENIRRSKSLQEGKFDTMVSTDVIFSPTLVDPLLETAAYLSKSDTVWYLCAQIRCQESHSAFLRRCPSFGFSVEDLSSDLNVFGRAMECFLFRLKRTNQQKRKNTTDTEQHSTKKPAIERLRIL